MKPISIQNDSTSQCSHWKFSFIALILIMLFTSFPLAADEETPKSVRRTSPTIAVDSAAKKIALVIGNKDYKDAPLRNPVNDAQDISNVLQGLGFVGTDQNRCEPPSNGRGCEGVYSKDSKR